MTERKEEKIVYLSDIEGILNKLIINCGYFRGGRDGREDVKDAITLIERELSSKITHGVVLKKYQISLREEYLNVVTLNIFAQTEIDAKVLAIEEIEKIKRTSQGFNIIDVRLCNS